MPTYDPYNTHETDSSRMYRLLGCALDYVQCMDWCGLGDVLDPRHIVFRFGTYDAVAGYAKVMDWIASNTQSHQL